MEYNSVSDISSQDVIKLRHDLGLKTSELASILGVNIKTIERWERGESKVTGCAATSLAFIYSYPNLINNLVIPPMKFDLRIKVYHKDFLLGLVSIIDVNEIDRFVELTNYTDRVSFLPFGEDLRPSYEEYNCFIKSLCDKSNYYDVIEELIKTGGNGEFTVVIETKN